MTANKKLFTITMTPQSTVSSKGEMMEGGQQERAWISALMDGELTHLTASQFDSLHHSQEQKNTWTLYHQIGDILRFEHQTLSHDFQIKLSNRLAQQSELVMPQQHYAGLATLAPKKIILIVAMLVVIVVLPSTLLLVKSSFSQQDKKVSDITSRNTTVIKSNPQQEQSPLVK